MSHRPCGALSREELAQTPNGTDLWWVWGVLVPTRDKHEKNMPPNTDWWLSDWCERPHRGVFINFWYAQVFLMRRQEEERW